MDDDVHERNMQALNEAFVQLGIPMETLLETAAGRWYVLHVQRELQAAPPPGDLSLAISNTIELAAGLPADQRQGVQGIGVLHLVVLSDSA